MSAIAYLLWSNKHNAWWAPGAWGYTKDIVAAGRFTEAEAVERVVRSAGCGDRTKVTMMVAAPENWTRPGYHPAESGAGEGEAASVPAPTAAGAPVGAGVPATDAPEFPPGTLEHEAYAAELKTELGKWATGEDPYPYASPFAYRAERRWEP